MRKLSFGMIPDRFLRPVIEGGGLVELFLSDSLLGVARNGSTKLCHVSVIVVNT